MSNLNKILRSRTVSDIKAPDASDQKQEIEKRRSKYMYWRIKFEDVVETLRTANIKITDLTGQLDNLNTSDQVHIDTLRRELVRLKGWSSDRDDELDALRRENTKLRDRAVQDWHGEVTKIVRKEIATCYPYYVTVTRHTRTLGADIEDFEAKVAASIGAKLGHWQGFKFVDGMPEVCNPAPAEKSKTYSGVLSMFMGAEPWAPRVKLDVPDPDNDNDAHRQDFKFTIGGKIQIMKGGAMGFFGTETTMVKITDDTLFWALNSLPDDLSEKCGQSVGGGSFVGGGVGSGQDPSISAAMTVYPDGSICLKLQVGSAVHEVRTSLTTDG